MSFQITCMQTVWSQTPGLRDAQRFQTTARLKYSLSKTFPKITRRRRRLAAPAGWGGAQRDEAPERELAEGQGLPAGRLESQGLPWLPVVWAALCPPAFSLGEVKTSLGQLWSTVFRQRPQEVTTPVLIMRNPRSGNHNCKTLRF